ncbi:MAG: flagellar biosynthesis protein FliQ [Oscillospiraceae bacterium]|nr:flagellar biosynthesis protein FliQ [Oscillospiraceae bacterium]
MRVFNDAMSLALKISGPMLAISVSVGLVIAILQAATQVHEQTLTFAPKAVLIALALLAFGPWMVQSINDFMLEIFELMSDVGLS